MFYSSMHPELPPVPSSSGSEGDWMAASMAKYQVRPPHLNQFRFLKLFLTIEWELLVSQRPGQRSGTYGHCSGNSCKKAA